MKIIKPQVALGLIPKKLKLCRFSYLWEIIRRPVVAVIGAVILVAMPFVAVAQGSTGSLAVYLYPDIPVRDFAAEWRLAAQSGNRATTTVPTGGNCWVWMQVIGDTPGTAWARCYTNGLVAAERTDEAWRGVAYNTLGVGPDFPPGTELTIALSDGQLNMGSFIAVQNVATGETRTLVSITEANPGEPASDWYRSGELVNGLDVGVRTVEFRDVPGWTTPRSQTVNIRAGETTTVNATYLVGPGALLWSFPLGYSFGSSAPAIGANGIVYITTGSGRSLLALNGASGVKLWEFPTLWPVARSSPAIGADGTVYVGSDGVWTGTGYTGSVYAVNGTTGTKRWEFALSANLSGNKDTGSPAIGADGTIYVDAMTPEINMLALCALNGQTGALLWKFAPTFGYLRSSPTIGKDGTVYFGFARTGGGVSYGIYAMNGETGVRLWESPNLGILKSSPAIGADGTLYVGSWGEDKVFALNPTTGAILWEFATQGGVSDTPAIGEDGTVYVGAQWDRFYALNGTTGTKLWEFSTTRPDGNKPSYNHTPAVGADGTVYVHCDSKLYALNGTTGAKQWEFTFTEGYGFPSSPAIGADGTVYVVSSGSGDGTGCVYALYGGTPLANSPWPMRGRDAQHTGRARPWPPGAVSLSLVSEKATIRWTGDFMLQTASEVKGPWVDLAAATSGYQVNSVVLHQFFRLRSK
ncbi:MAG: PQQ-binding-like beta-propeller repeat protein [Verrucomicrobia bacterium]|nr:PQQ-binding-like beta-propeller repeat protein [Verrucomicrobiota bacterium]